jgi:hypothetical protein
MYLGKGTKERKMRWERGTVQSAMCVMVGCSGVEDFWHVTSECVGGDMVKVRGEEFQEFQKRKEALRGKGVDNNWLWALTQLWGVDGRGQQHRWEEMDWGEFNAQLIRLGEARAGQVNEGRGRIECSLRARLLVDLCQRTPSDLRWNGTVDYRWGQWMAKLGVSHAGARAIMEVVAWVSKEYGDKCWYERNRVELAEGRGVVKENQRRAQLMREEGAEIAGKLGWGEGKVKYHFGSSQRVGQVKKKLDRVRALWWEVSQRVGSDGQMRIDQMVVGHTVDTEAGKRKGRAARRQRWDQQQLALCTQVGQGGMKGAAQGGLWEKRWQ